MLRVGIVGGGISGLAAAVALRAAGHEVAIFERAAVLKEIGSGLTLWSNATRALQSLGLLPAVLARSHTIHGFSLRQASGRLLMRIPIEHFTTAAIAVHRYDLQAALLAALPAGLIHTAQAVRGVREAGKELSLQIGDGASGAGPFDLVLGADGVRSVVRPYVVARDLPLRYQGYTIWRGVARAAELGKGADVGAGISESWGRGQRFGILPLGAGRICWYATANAKEAVANTTPDDRGDERKALLLRLYGAWHAPIAGLIAATPAALIAEHAACDRAGVPGWSRGATLLVGDAAHPLTPNLGQGGCMALEDAVVLGKLLAEVTQPTELPALLMRFEQLRYRRVQAMVRRCRWLGALGQWQHPVVAPLRNGVAELLPGAIFARTSRKIQSYAPDQVV